jgi:hypothetical protein
MTAEETRAELDRVRNALLNMMPLKVQVILMNGLSCTTRQDWLLWNRRAVNDLIEVADARPAREMKSWSSFTDRAYCPLCRGGAVGDYGEGYAVPKGLRAHLDCRRASGIAPCEILQVFQRWALERVRNEPEGT